VRLDTTIWVKKTNLGFRIWNKGGFANYLTTYKQILILEKTDLSYDYKNTKWFNFKF
jgi:hypothetical protein